MLMGRRSQYVLGLALSEQGIELAEVRHHRHDTELVRADTLRIAHPLDAPAESGAALADHLRERGYTAREVVVGLPAWRLLARHKVLPNPPSEEALNDMLRLAIEREFAGGAQGLCGDYCKWSSPDAAGKANVLLVAMANDVLGCVKQLVGAAGLRVRAVTPTLLAVAQATKGVKQEAGVSHEALLTVGAQGAELYVHGSGGPRGVTHLQSFEGSTEAQLHERLSEAVMRALVAGMADDAQAPTARPRVAVVSDAATKDVATKIAGALAEWAQVFEAGVVSSAEALARAGVTSMGEADEGVVIDLAHGKLAPDARARAGGWRRHRVAALAAIVLMLGVIGGGGIWYDAARRVAELEREYEAIRDEAARLQQVRERTLAAEPWFAAEPMHLACLWDLTRIFPEEHRIWVNHLRLRSEEGGAIQCRAASREAMIALREAMERSSAFERVELRDWQETGRDDGRIRFEITFDHVPRRQRLFENGR